MFKKIAVIMAVIIFIAGSAFAETVGRKEITGSGVVATGKCRLLKVNMYSATAGDIIGVYDTSPTIRSLYKLSAYDIKTLEFEMSISANTSSNFMSLDGYPFEYGIEVLTKNAATVSTFLFDY